MWRGVARRSPGFIPFWLRQAEPQPSILPRRVSFRPSRQPRHPCARFASRVIFKFSPYLERSVRPSDWRDPTDRASEAAGRESANLRNLIRPQAFHLHDSPGGIRAV